MVRYDVEAGSMPYSAVSHPIPAFSRNPGTLSSTLAVQMTRVCPHEMRHEPGAEGINPGRIVIGRASFQARSFKRFVMIKIRITNP